MRRHLPSPRHLVHSLLLLLTAVLTTAVSHADEAQDAFNEGMKLLGQGKYDAACAAFDKSEVAAGGESVRTRYQLGRCNEERGKPVIAHGAFLDAARLSDAEGDGKRAGVARQRAAELAPKVALLVIEVPEPQRVEGLTIKRDGKDVPARDWGVAIAVDPGEHTVEVEAPNQQPMTLKVGDAEVGKKAQITVPPFGSPTDPSGNVAAPTTPPSEEPESGGTRFNNGALFWTGVGLGGGGLIAAGLGAAAWYQINFNHFQGAPPPAAIAAFGASVVFFGVGIPFMVVGGRRVPDEPEPAAQGLVVQPFLTPMGGGLVGSF